LFDREIRRSRAPEKLLHARLKIRGYRRYTTLGTMDDEPQLLNYLSEALDNELQHHKMYPQFRDMGFKPDEFYHDNDEVDFAALQAEIGSIRPDEHPGALLLNFVILIAPGGSESGDIRIEMRRIFQERCGAANWDKMLAIEREFDAWERAGDLDAGMTIAAIFKHLGRLIRRGWRPEWIFLMTATLFQTHLVCTSLRITWQKQEPCEKF
jgi:hypothetical protein